MEESHLPSSKDVVVGATILEKGSFPVTFVVRSIVALAIIEPRTFNAHIAVANVPVHVPVTSQVRVIVWSPVFVPLEVPENVPD